MVNINHVADFIILFFREKGENITNLKLQKLLYYTQAWHLAIHGRPMFEGNFQAWTHGPVNVSVYNRFSDYRWQPITEAIQGPNISQEEEAHIQEVLESYGGFGAYELERLTHSERPWKNARGDLPADSGSNRVISEEDMKAYYRELLNRNEEQ